MSPALDFGPRMDFDIGLDRFKDFDSPRLRLALPMEAEELAIPDIKPPDFRMGWYVLAFPVLTEFRECLCQTGAFA